MPDRPATCPAHTDDHDPCTRPLGHRAHHETATGLAWFNTPRESPMSKHETSQAWNEQARVDHIQDQDRIIRRRNEEIREQAQTIKDLEARVYEAERDASDHRDNTQSWKLISEGWEAEAEEWKTIATRAEPRALSPEDISDEAVERARDRARQLGEGLLSHYSIRELLTAALTPPPKRPEGAERLESQIEAWDHEYGDDAIMTAPRLRELADFLAERGVRVVGEEQS